jgi:hypothetical protein
MQRDEFFFEDYAEHYYSSTTYDRFYEVVANKQQLARLLITPQSVKLLQQQSALYQRTIYTTLAAAVLVYPLSRMAKGAMSKVTVTLGGLMAVAGGLWWSNDSCRKQMLALKQRVYSENRPNFRKYELTGDIQLANSKVQLVDS